MNIRIEKVVPTDEYNLIVRFEGGGLRRFPNTVLRDTDIWFLAFPMKLRSYIELEDGLQWKSCNKQLSWKGKNVWDGEVMLSSSDLVKMSDSISQADVQSSLLTIGMNDQAPTEQDARHHVYFVAIRPFESDKWLVFGESIGGGFAERGGSISLSSEELSQFEGWESHCVLAGCDWLVPILKSKDERGNSIVDDIIYQYKQTKI